MSYDVFCQYYDELTENVCYDKRADYYNELLKANGISNGILLDAGCGTGTFSIEMANKGFDVIGVDISIGMLMKAKEKSYSENVDVLFLNQSMDNLDLYGTVDCATSVLDCINHLEGKTNVLKAFKSISLFMNPGGIFIFDVNTIYKHREVLSETTFVFETEHVYCVWQNGKCVNDVIDITLDFFSEDYDGLYNRFSENFSEKAYSLMEINKMLNESGFEIINIFEDMTTKPIQNEEQIYKEKIEKVVYVVKKVH